MTLQESYLPLQLTMPKHHDGMPNRLFAPSMFVVVIVTGESSSITSIMSGTQSRPAGTASTASTAKECDNDTSGMIVWSTKLQRCIPNEPFHFRK